MRSRTILYILGAAICISVGAAFYFSRPQAPSLKTEPEKTNSDKTVPARGSRRALFVPYWDTQKRSDAYDRYYYFGVAPTGAGISTADAGYTALDDFISQYDAKSSLLTLRMTDFDTNRAILSNARSQEAIIRDAVKLATDNGFAGIALDLEYSGIFDGSIPGKILTFSHRLAEAAHDAGLTYSFIVYGDVYYRARPYDVQEIAKHSDEIVIMAYDFHKSRGEPGPNFPLRGKETYGYDLVQMIAEFKLAVPADKITVAHGMYGYEWTVDEQKRPIKPAAPLSLNEIAESYDDECEALNCIRRRDSQSTEEEIQYVSDNGDYHIIWHEDNESVDKKQDYLKKQGIGSFAYWANGYF